MKIKEMTRREFLRYTSLAGLGGLLAACAVPPTPVPTVAPAATSAPVATAASAATKAPVATTVPAAAAIKGGPLEVGVLWTEGTPYYDLVKQIGDSMVKDYAGTTMTYTFANTQARPAIETRTRAGNPLDIDNIFDGMDRNAVGWATGGYLYDLTAAMNAPRADGTTWKSDFNPAFLSAMTYQDKIYSVPDQLWYFAIHYNKKMFDDWGLTPPKTWSELLATCDKIKAKGVAPIALTGQAAGYVAQWWDHLLMKTVGPDKVLDYLYGDNDSKIAGDPTFLKVAQEMQKLAKNGYLIDGWQGTDFTTAQVYFFQGKAAMILMGSWLATEMQASIPPGFQLAVTQFPTVDGFTVPANVMGRATCWSVASKSKNPELAVEYLRRFTTKSISDTRTEKLGAISPLAGAKTPAQIIGMDKLIEETKSARVVHWYYSMPTSQFGLPAAWRTAVVEMMLGTTKPEDVPAKIDTAIAAVRAQRKAAK